MFLKVVLFCSQGLGRIYRQVQWKFYYLNKGKFMGLSNEIWFILIFLAVPVQQVKMFWSKLAVWRYLSSSVFLTFWNLLVVCFEQIGWPLVRASQSALKRLSLECVYKKQMVAVLPFQIVSSEKLFILSLRRLRVNANLWPIDSFYMSGDEKAKKCCVIAANIVFCCQFSIQI